jgi:molybdopterin/thiamine biosynthesis adenylyltransferase
MSGPMIDRYSRQTILPEVGPAGQARLRDASVLVIGAGGLGSAVLQYLCAAGVGHLAIVDNDRVEESNLHRQPIYRMSDVGALRYRRRARLYWAPIPRCGSRRSANGLPPLMCNA